MERLLSDGTRWQTRGDASNNLNNHPINTKYTIGTHNGTITNADYLFWRYGLPREAEVDSEVIFQIADSALHQSRYDIPKLIERLSLCRGEMSAVMSSKTDPGTIVIIKGDKPLEFCYHSRCRALVYASDGESLGETLTAESDCLSVPMGDESLAVLDCCTLLGPGGVLLRATMPLIRPSRDRLHGSWG